MVEYDLALRVVGLFLAAVELLNPFPGFRIAVLQDIAVIFFYASVALSAGLFALCNIDAKLSHFLTLSAGWWPRRRQFPKA